MPKVYMKFETKTIRRYFIRRYFYFYFSLFKMNTAKFSQSCKMESRLRSDHCKIAIWSPGSALTICFYIQYPFVFPVSSTFCSEGWPNFVLYLFQVLYEDSLQYFFSGSYSLGKTQESWQMFDFKRKSGKTFKIFIIRDNRVVLLLLTLKKANILLYLLQL